MALHAPGRRAGGRTGRGLLGHLSEGTLAAMDPFALIMLGIVVALIVSVLLLGRFHPKSGADVLRWEPTRSAEVEVQNEIDDLEQMLEATNRRRRARGEPELTETALRDQVAEDLRATQERRDAYRAQEDIRQMLEATNERRRRRGEPELTEAQLRAEVEEGR